MPARRFKHVPFGARAEGDAIACDGLVPGAALDLSHWAGNRTPLEYKRDTSTESAIVYATSRTADSDALTLAVNNHFDTDGALSVFALVEPEIASAHAALLVAAAEAGDFDVWPDDERGLWLDAAVGRVGRGSDSRAYARVLDALPDLLANLERRSDLWGADWDALSAAGRAADAGDLVVDHAERITVFRHRPGVGELPGAVLSRLARPDTTRWLIAFERDDGRFEYRYERPRWAWADTVTRPAIPAPSRNAIAVDLGAGWALKGELGMTGLLRTASPIRMTPERVTEALLRRDHGARMDDTVAAQ